MEHLFVLLNIMSKSTSVHCMFIVLQTYDSLFVKWRPSNQPKKCLQLNINNKSWIPCLKSVHQMGCVCCSVSLWYLLLINNEVFLKQPLWVNGRPTGFQFIFSYQVNLIARGLWSNEKFIQQSGFQYCFVCRAGTTATESCSHCTECRAVRKSIR